MNMRALKILSLVIAQMAFASWASAALEISVAIADVRNASIADEDGDYPAVITITNASDAPSQEVLFNYFLTDDPENPTKWRFPDGRFLAAGESIRVFASGKNRAQTQGELHTNFRYRCSVSYLGLNDDNGNLIDEKIEEGVQLIGKNAPVRCLVPSAPVLNWQFKGFNDANWRSGVFGVGYDRGIQEGGGDPELTDDLVLYLPMDVGDVASPKVYDRSGSAIVHDGDMVGNPLPSNAGGKVREGLRFTQNANYVQVPHDNELSIQTGDYSVALWINPQDLIGGLQPIASKLNTQQTSGWVILASGQQTVIRIQAGPGQVRQLVFGPLRTQQFNFLAFTIDAATLEFKGFKGDCVAPSLNIMSTTLPGGFMDGNQNALYLHASNGFISGMPTIQDEFALWRRLLSETEVNDVWRLGVEGKSIQEGDPSGGGGGGKTLPGPYEPCIRKDVETEMYGVNATIYLRVPFTIQEDPKMYERMFLKFYRDDGYVLYLNGTEIARRLAPSASMGGAGLTHTSNSTQDRADPLAKDPEVLNLSQYINLLCQGENVLAIHGLNSDKSADRYLFDICRLCLQKDPVEVPTCIKDTTGTDFWVAFPDNYDPDPTNPLRPFVCIAGAPGTTVTVEGDGLDFLETHTILGNGQKVVELGELFSITSNDLVEPKGVHVTSSAPVSVYAASKLDYSTDSTLVLPVQCLGTEYLVMAYQNVTPGIPELNGSEFAIVAIENGTAVTITPSADTQGSGGLLPSGAPYTVLLDRGDTYQLRNDTDIPGHDDLTGTLITSNRPVGVFGAHRCANVYDETDPTIESGFFCDHLLEQVLPTAAWGLEYVSVPLETRIGGDTIRVLASVDGTTVSLNGAAVTVLNRGEFEDFTRSNATQITGNHPILVAQYSNSSDVDGVVDSDPFMVCLQPVESYMSQYTFCLLDPVGIDDSFVNIVTTDAGRGSIAVDGVVVSVGESSPVPSSSLFHATVPVTPTGTNVHEASGPVPFGLTIYGFSEYESFGNSGGMQFLDRQAPIVDVPGQVTITCNTPDWEPGVIDCAVMPDLVREFGYVFDNCTPEEELTVVQSIPPGTVLREGIYTVDVDVADESGNTNSFTVDLEVTPPWLGQVFALEVLAVPALRNVVWGPDADPDCDRRSNLVEYALGTDPNIGICEERVLKYELTTPPPLPYLPADPFLTMTFVRRLSDPALRYIPEVSVDGVNWDSSNAAVRQVGSTVLLPGGEFERVTYRQRVTSAGAPQTAFMRLRITYQNSVIPLP